MHYCIQREAHLCVQFLLQKAGFYYLLTFLRCLSSDSVERMFSHVKLIEGSNVATGPAYALQQIVRCDDIVKSSKSSNAVENVDYVSSAKFREQK